MENKKDIGKAFREKLDRLEMAPGSSVWDAISADLEKNKRSPKFTGWIKGVLLAVLSVAFITILLVWINHSSGPETTGTEKEAKIENGQNVTDTSNDAGNSNPNHPGDKSNLNTVENENSGNTITQSETYGQARDEASNGIVQKKQSSGRTVSESKKSGNKIGKSNRPVTSATDRRAITPESDGMPPTKNQILSKSGNKKSGEKQSQTVRKSIRNEVSAANPITKSAKNTDPASNSKGSTAPSNIIAAGRTTGNATVQDAVQSEKEGGRKSEVAKASSKSSDTGDFKNATGKGTIDTTASSDIATESKTVTDTLTNNVADSLATEPVITSKPMDFAKIADSLNKLYGREDKKARTVKDTIAYKKFHLYAFGAATLYKLPENGSYIDPSLSSKNSDAKVSVPFGGYLGYSLSRKCIVRVGIILTRFQQDIKDVNLSNTYIAQDPTDEFPDGWTQTRRPPNFRGISYQDGVSNATVMEQLSTGNDAAQNPVAVVNINSRTEIMEIPVELLFQVYDSKIGVDLLCGFSMRTLTSSEVYAENDGGRIFMGSINNAEKKMKGYAATFGVNLNYDFTSNLQLNLEPVVRYYFQTQGFGEPYTLGIQAGIQYNFDLFRTKK